MVPVAETAGTAAAPAEPPGRPESRTDTLVIEGVPQPVDLRLVRAPAGFPLPFSAYVPPDFEVEAATRDGQPAVRFVAAFGGVRNQNAFVEVALYPPDLGQAGALERAATSMNPSGEPEILDEGGFDWAELGWRWRGGGAEPFVARFLLGRHGDRWFQVLQRYPPEYGDGFGPRAALLLESLRWGEG